MKVLLLRSKITLILTFLSIALPAQIFLGPSIGMTAEPMGSASICTIPTYLDPDQTFYTPGLLNGDTIPHFKLYKTNGDSIDILTVLQQGKPVLLVGGSITCPVFRGKIADINAVAAQYAGQLNVYVVYIVEAHPNTPDVSPYSGTVWTTGQNVTDNCLYLQPTTYQERMNLADTTDARFPITPDILVDGPCNLWWSTFGTAPNSGFLIRPDGIIFKKHGWFNRQNVYDIYNDVDSLLNSLAVPVCDCGPNYINVFPNPSSGSTHLSVSGLTGSAAVTIYQMNGSKVYASTIYPGEKQLALENLQSGVYFVEVITGITTFRRKIILTGN